MQARAAINSSMVGDPTISMAEREGLTRAVPALALRAPSRRRSGVLRRRYAAAGRTRGFEPLLYSSSPRCQSRRFDSTASNHMAEREGLTRAVPALALRAPSRRRSGVLRRRYAAAGRTRGFEPLLYSSSPRCQSRRFDSTASNHMAEREGLTRA